MREDALGAATTLALFEVEALALAFALALALTLVVTRRTRTRRLTIVSATRCRGASASVRVGQTLAGVQDVKLLRVTATVIHSFPFRTSITFGSKTGLRLAAADPRRVTMGLFEPRLGLSTWQGMRVLALRSANAASVRVVEMTARDRRVQL